MSNHALSKQPGEKFYIEMDFSKNFTSGETVNIGSSSVTVIDKDGVDKSTDIIDAGTLAASSTNNGLIARIKGGLVTAEPYKITFVLTTSAGNVWEDDISLGIREV